VRQATRSRRNYLLPNELNPDGYDFVDLGLGVTVGDPAENGKFRVPTLRHVALTGPYLHNGIFKTLFTVVAFYNTRDVAPWPGPEVEQNVNTEEMGNLKLSNQEVEDIVAFMNSLTDGRTQVLAARRELFHLPFAHSPVVGFSTWRRDR